MINFEENCNFEKFSDPEKIIAMIKSEAIHLSSPSHLSPEARPFFQRNKHHKKWYEIKKWNGIIDKKKIFKEFIEGALYSELAILQSDQKRISVLPHILSVAKTCSIYHLVNNGFSEKDIEMLQQRFAFYKKSAADKPEKLLFREMDFCEMYLNQYLTDIENHEKNGYEIVEDTDHALRATLSRRSQIELWAVNYNLDIGPIKERLEKYDEKWSRAWPQAKLIWPWVFNEGISGQFWYPKRWHWYQRGGIPDLQKNLIDLNLVPSDYFKRNHFAEVREMVMKK